MRRLWGSGVLCVVAVAGLAACGGGGGGGAASSGAIAVPATAGPTATPMPLTAQGFVRDLGGQRFANDGNAAGAAIAGATVVVGPVLILGATPPPTLPAGDAQAVTGTDGSYRVAGYTAGSPTYAMVFPPAGDAHVSSHALANIANAQIRTQYLYEPTAAETAELAQINSDRASNGAGPVIFDEIGFETARAHADFMAGNGYYAHCIPACGPSVGAPPLTYPPQYSSPQTLYAFLNGIAVLPIGAQYGENFAFNVTGWPQAEALFVAEKGTSSTGHYDQLVYAGHNWAGLGDNQTPMAPASFGLFVQEFY